MSERLDRGIVQVKRTDDAWELSKRLNEELRRLSERIAKLEGRSGGTTVKNSLSVRSDEPTMLDMESSIAGKAAFSGTTGATRSFEIAKGARREKDGQWVATDTGAVILQLKDDGTMVMYADTNLVVGAAYAPTSAIVFPSGTAQHGLVSATHTATGLTIGDVLQATATNAFGFDALPAHFIITDHYPGVNLAPGDSLTATGTGLGGMAWGPPGFSGCMAYATATQTLTNDTYVPMAFAGEYFDTSTYHSTSSNNSRFTPPSNSYYGMVGRIRFAGLAGGLTGYKVMTIEKNSAGTHTAGNVLSVVCFEPVQDANVVTVPEISAVAYLTTGDYVELFAFRHEPSGNGATAISTNQAYNEPSFTIWRIGS